MLDDLNTELQKVMQTEATKHKLVRRFFRMLYRMDLYYPDQEVSEAWRDETD